MKKIKKPNQTTPLRDNIRLMVDAAWALATASLWDKKVIHYEVRQTKREIRAFLSATLDPFGRYLQLCQRVLVCWKEKLDNPETVIPISAIWLTCPLSLCFPWTLTYYEEIQLKRKQTALYLHSWKALPEAFLEMAETPSREIYRFWIEWFLDRDNMEEMKLFVAGAYCSQPKSFSYGR